MLKVRWFAAVAIACGMAATPTVSFAQEAAPAAAPAAPAPRAAAAVEYETIPILPAIYKDGKETEATKNIGKLVRDVISGQQPLAQNESSFDKYFTLYIFPLMTQTDDKSLTRLPKERTAFIRNYLALVKRQDVHDHVVQLTFRSLKDVVTKNYHPAVRYNAMLIIGELNSKEPVFTGAATIPLPFAEALDFMTAQLRDPQQIDAVRVAALLGILRHADMNAHSQQPYPPAVRQGLIKLMLPIALEKKVPADRSEEGHAWMRSRAVEVVAALGQPAYDAAVVQGLVSIIGDTAEPLQVRFTAAASLGRLDLRPGTTINGDEIARKVADLAIEAARQQLAVLDDEIAAEKEKQKLLGNTGPTYRGGERGIGIPGLSTTSTGEFYGEIPIAVVKQEQRITLMQRLLKDRMVKTRFALEGPDSKNGAISRAVKPDYIKNVSAAMLALQKVADLRNLKQPDRATTVPELAKEMRTKITDLERVAKSGGAPAPAAPVAPAGVAEGPEGPEDPATAPLPMTKKGPAAPAAPAGEGPEDPAAAPPAAAPPAAAPPAAAPMAKKAPAEEAP